jgi:outer membrane protein assembly factor BamB
VSRPGPTRTGLRWFSIQFATVLLLLITLFFGYLAYRDNHPATVPSVQATPTAVATPNDHSWPMAGGNAAGTRNVPGPAPAGQPMVLWTADVGSNNNVETGVLAGGVLYWPGNGRLAALDTKTGQRVWFTTEVTGQAAIDGDGLIVPSAAPNGSGYDLVRIRRSDGQVVWRAAAGTLPEQAAVAIADGVGYVPSGQDLLAFDPATGQELWRVPRASAGQAYQSVAGDIGAIGGEVNTLTAFSTNDGDVLWTYQINEESVGRPALANGTVYFRSQGAGELAFYSLDAATGTLKWRVPAAGGNRFSNPAVSDTTVYTVGADGNLYALDAATGATRWTFPTTPADLISAVLAGDTVFITSPQGTLYAVDAASGTERWHFRFDGPIDTPPVVVDGVAYVHSTAGVLYAIGGSASGAVPVASPAAPASVAPAGTPVISGGVAEFLWTIPRDPSTITPVSGPDFDPYGRIWIADGVSKQYRIYDLDGTLLDSWGSAGSDPGQISFDPFLDTEFAADGSFYVLDVGNHRIQKFAPDRSFLFAWGSQGTGDGQFAGGPSDVAIGADGTVYVCDHGNHRIQVFDAQGTYLRQFGSPGRGDGELHQPFGLALDAAGNVYVADTDNHRVEVFAPDGIYLARWGLPGQYFDPWRIVVRGGTAYVNDGDNVDKFKLLPPLDPS